MFKPWVVRRPSFHTVDCSEILLSPVEGKVVKIPWIYPRFQNHPTQLVGLGFGISEPSISYGFLHLSHPPGVAPGLDHSLPPVGAPGLAPGPPGVGVMPPVPAPGLGALGCGLGQLGQLGANAPGLLEMAPPGWGGVGWGWWWMDMGWGLRWVCGVLGEVNNTEIQGGVWFGRNGWYFKNGSVYLI